MRIIAQETWKFHQVAFRKLGGLDLNLNPVSYRRDNMSSISEFISSRLAHHPLRHPQIIQCRQINMSPLHLPVKKTNFIIKTTLLFLKDKYIQSENCFGALFTILNNIFLLKAIRLISFLLRGKSLRVEKYLIPGI